MPADILALAGQVDQANRALAQSGYVSAPLPSLPRVRVLIAGPASAGKTTLIRGILGDAAKDLPARLPAGVPVEFTGGELGGGVAVTRAEVRLDAPVLRDWNIELVDTLAIDRPLGDGRPTLGLDPGSRDGVLYVVPSRVLTDRDRFVLEALRGHPVIVIQNLKDDEIATSTESFAPVAVERSAGGYALPIALARAQQPSPERDLLRLAVALLQAEVLASEVRIMRDAVPRRLRRLRADYRRRLDAVLAVEPTSVPGTHPNPWPVMEAALNLMSIERDGPAHAAAEESLLALARLLNALPVADHYRSLAHKQAEEAGVRYDVESFSSVRVSLGGQAHAASLGQPGSAQVGEDIGQLRQVAREYVRKLCDDPGLRLTGADRTGLAAIEKQIGDDRLELIFAGQFSAGKSTLINALLAVHDLLPARRLVTTATVNELRHAARTTVDVRWRPDDNPLELTLLRPTGAAPRSTSAASDGGSRSGIVESDAMPGQYEVHRDEITALASWLATQAVSPTHCTFFLEGGSIGRRGDGRKAFDSLVYDLQAGASATGMLPGYVYTIGQTPKISSATFPIAATVNRFAIAPAIPAGNGQDGTEVGAVLDRISADPAVTLRIHRVQIGYPHDLLRHITIVDTPGTDAPNPRHRVLTEEAIKEDRARAVVYCFNGNKGAAEEDRRNLDVLKACQTGSSDLSRFFFVITQRGLNNDDQAKEIRDKVAGQIASLGIDIGRLYFTEVVQEQNDDFHALAAALNDYAIKSKAPRLRGWLEEINRIVSDAADRERAILQQLKQGESERQAGLAALRREHAAVQSLISQLDTDSSWGVPRARKRAQPLGLGRATDLGKEIAALVTRESFSEFEGNADKYLADLNAQARTRATEAWESSTAKARAVLAGGAAGHRTVSLPGLAISGEVFPSAEFLATVRSSQWRSGWQRVKGIFAHTKWNQDVDDNRARIERAWEACSKNAAATVGNAIDSAASGAQAELRRLEEGISTQLASQSEPPSNAQGAAAEAGLARTAYWLQMLGKLVRMIEVNSRGAR